MDTDTTAPQSCYPEEIETLQEMLDEIVKARDKHAEWCEMMAEPVSAYRKTKDGRRIDALRTAIEALGGAL